MLYWRNEVKEQFLGGCEAGVDRAEISCRPAARMSSCLPGARGDPAAAYDPEESCLHCPALVQSRSHCNQIQAPPLLT